LRRVCSHDDGDAEAQRTNAVGRSEASRSSGDAGPEEEGKEREEEEREEAMETLDEVREPSSGAVASEPLEELRPALLEGACGE
jgi:hypothetical protein